MGRRTHVREHEFEAALVGRAVVYVDLLTENVPDQDKPAALETAIQLRETSEKLKSAAKHS
jgi:hypothetical protein